MAKSRDEESPLTIVGMGYRGRLPGDSKRQAKAWKKAKDLLALAEEAKKRSGKAKKKNGS